MPTNQTSSVSTIEPARRRQHTSSRRSRPSYRFEAKIKRYKVLLAGLSILLCIVLIFSFLNQTKKSSEYHQMLLDLRKQEALASKLGKASQSLKDGNAGDAAEALDQIAQNLNYKISGRLSIGGDSTMPWSFPFKSQGELDLEGISTGKTSP